MKRKNGENIITSDDITVLGKNSGKSLELVIEQLQEDSDALKSNVKWLYKYGGVGGSGSGGGSNTPTFSDKWSATVQLNIVGNKPINIPLTDVSSTDYLDVMFKESNSIKIVISNPYGQEFKATIKYANRVITGGNVLFNKAEGYSKDCPIDIKSNGILEIQIADTAAATDPKFYKINCIINAYNFEEHILYDNNIEITKNTRNTYLSYMSDMITNGNIKYLLIASTYYKFPMKIVWTTIDKFLHELTFNIDSSVLYNNADLFNGGVPIIDNLDFFIPDGNAIYDKAGTYIFNVKKYIIDGNQDLLIENSNFMIDVIPRELYLSILPRSNFIIYLSNDVLDPVATYKGSKEFAITPYMGSVSDGSTVAVRIKVNGQVYGDDLSIEIRKTANPVVHFTLPENVLEDWVTISFDVCPDKLFLPSNTKTFVRYLRIKNYDQTIDWYSGIVQDGIGTHYRFGEEATLPYCFKYTSTNQYLNGSSKVVRSNNDEGPIEIKSEPLTTLGADQVLECMINVGIQYNDINNDETKILKITGSSGNTDFTSIVKTDITISLNSINYGSSPIGYVKSSLEGGGTISGFFINKEVDYKTSDNTKYLLITIIRRYIKTVATDNGDADKYELSVYINGVLLTCYSSLIEETIPYCKFILNNCNYSINLLDIQHFGKGSLSDASAVRYWYAYESNLLDNNEDIETKLRLLNTFSETFDPNVLSELNLLLGRVKVTAEGFNSLCELRTVPILCVTYDSSAYNGKSFMDWSDLWRAANQDPTEADTVDVKVWWKGKTESKTRSLNFDDDVRTIIGTPDDGDINALFKLSILGSTTRTYKSKNYTLKLSGQSESGLYIPIFTPNFDPIANGDTNEQKEYKYKHNFLPESEFTLKADVVDSSHTNNTCMGSFINDVSTKFNLAGSLSGRYTAYIKNCLQGFPFLMFAYESNTREYYYLGIYNFNLGRKSYFNLGYANISLLDNFDFENNMKTLYYVRREDYQTVRNGFISAEILDNKAEFDFSLFDLSILFKLDDIDDRYMFGDIVPEHIDNDYTNEQKSISKFVKNISRAGGYIFKMLGKGFTDGNIDPESNPGYTVPHFVNLATQLWEKYKKNDGNIGYRKLPETEPLFTQNDLTDCILLHIGGSGEEEDAYCDYTSLVEYYTICMAFGLLDNVQKNLTIKTWNNKENGIGTYHFAFYDMDTCLGINNIAGDVKYFAFSDYWGDSETDTGTTISVIDEEQEQHLYLLDSINILRDYTPGAALDYFDIPSHYAFAIAKYAKTVLGDSRIISPQDLWAFWRTNLTLTGITETKVGCLQNAQTFLDNYYLKYMDGVDELMFNYNYRAKYFREKSGGITYDEELSRFHGNRRNYVKDWLTKRFHILDAYFNLPKSNIPINDGNEIVNNGAQAEFYESTYSNNLIDFAGNSDVLITKDIFTSAGTTFGSPKDDDPSTWLIIKAPDYTPLMVRLNQSIKGRFLINNDSRFYKINYEGGGASLRLTFLGSTLWTYIHNINFLNGDCSINSRYLENLVGNKGNVSNWDLTLPSLRIVSLINNRGYSGSLIFNLNEMGGSEYKLFPDLKTVDISGSSISLTLNSGNIKNVNLNNIRSTDINITNCPSLVNVLCNNMTITDRCTLEVSWVRNFTLSGCNINNLIVSGKVENGLALGKLNISMDSSMTSLTVSTYKEITVSNCEKLTSFVSNTATTEKITINTCKNLKNVTVDLTNCNSLILNNCNLENVILYASNINDFAKLKTFLINGSTFENIHFRITNTSNDLNSTNTLGLLVLTPLTGLTDFFIRNNENIKYIQFANNKLNPVLSLSSLPFLGLTNLERIYGNIKFGNAYYLFYRLPKFSLHGPTNEGSITINGTTYNKIKKVTIDNREYNIILTPLQLISGETAAQEEWDYDTIISHYNTIYNTGIGALWLSGEGVTNISFNVNMNSSSFSHIGYDSGLTLFDIYYLFNSLALSKINTNVTFDYAFYNSSLYPNCNLYRKFKYSEGNQFNRYMFYGCEKIISLGSYIFIVDSNDVLLYPPETDSQGNILHDNGLFSPLVNLTGISVFCSSAAYSNRFIFRRKEGNYNSLKSIGHLYICLLDDNINDYKVKPPTAFNLNETLYGSLKDIFKNTPNLEDITVFDFSGGQLDFTDLVIPDKVVSIYNSFNCNWGKGKLLWDKTFDSTKTYSRLEQIVNSFRISTFIGSSGVEFELHDMMFANMPVLKHIGYRCPDPGKHFDIGGVPSSEYGGTQALTHNSPKYYFTVGFSGNGYSKKLRNGVFPYDILKNVGINSGSSKINQIRTFGGLFSYLTPSNLIASLINFPAQIFEGASNLEDISALFMNSTIPINLTAEGFKDCHYLFNVTRLFYIDSSLTGNITSLIPYHFFYIGYDNDGENIYYTTKENVDYNTINISEVLSNAHKARIKDLSAEELDSAQLRTVSTSYKNYNKYIKFAAECFSGQNKLLAYTWNGSNANIPNINYIPVEHYINTNTNQWETRPNERKYIALYDISEIYDGEYGHLTALGNNYYCKDSDNIIVDGTTNPGKIGGRNYICPPDIFNYFNNVSDVSVRGFFRWCGSSKTGHNGGLSYTNRRTSDDNLYGRVCPYLFDPISNVESLIDFFEWCRGLSTYKISGEVGDTLYMLPYTLFNNLRNLKNIAKMVSGTYINKPVVWPFNNLNGRSLDIRGLFACCDYSNETRVNMSGLFNGLILNNISGVFSCYEMNLHGTTTYTLSLLESSQNAGLGISLYRGFTIHLDTFKNTLGTFSDNFSGANIPNLDQTKFLYFGYKSSDNLVSETSISRILNNVSLYNLGSVN